MGNIDYHIDKQLRKVFRKKGFATAEIINDWALIVDDEMLSKYSNPLKITYPVGKQTEGTLHVEVAGPMAMELEQRKEEIISKIASYFGYKAIENIKVSQNNKLVVEK